MSIITILLWLAAIYCGGSWLYLCFRTFARGENWETQTFHLGLCFILALGFLGLMGG